LRSGSTPEEEKGQVDTYRPEANRKKNTREIIGYIVKGLIGNLHRDFGKFTEGIIAD